MISNKEVAVKPKFAIRYVKNRKPKTAFGYWYSTIFIAVKRTRSCLMTLEGIGVEEYLSHRQNRKSDISQILMSTLFHKRKMGDSKNDNNSNIIIIII